MKNILAALTFLILILFPSCEMLGLGESLDMDGPELLILSPANRQNVKDGFEISGFISDDNSLGTITVTVGDDTWIINSGVCFKKNSSGTFESYGDFSWTPISSSSANWSIRNVTVPGSGDYEILVAAADKAGNSSARSVQMRFVMADLIPPKISLREPYVRQELSDIKGIYDALSDHHNYTLLQNIVTGGFTISGNQADDSEIKWLKVRLNAEDGSPICEKRLIQNERQRTSPSDIMVDTLRAWAVNIEESELSAYSSGRNYFNIILESEDISDNTTSLEDKGWMIYWKDASQSWNEVNGGTPSGRIDAYTGAAFSGVSYDDKCVRNVRVVFKKGGTVYSEQKLEPQWSASDISTVYYWNVAVPSVPGDYDLEITANHGEADESPVARAYINVKDVTWPSVSVVSPSQNVTLFGNSAGDFTITVSAMDDTGISSLKCAWIRNEADTVNYMNKGYSGWTSAVPGGFTDGRGNKVYSMTPVPDGSSSAGGITRKKYKGTISLNLFSDLGIDFGTGTKFSNQHFIFLAEDGNSNRAIADASFTGDIEAPSVTITGISYEGAEYTQSTSTVIPVFASGSPVTVKGKWRDNSYSAWRDVGKLSLDVKVGGNSSPAVTLNSDGTFTATTTVPNIGSLSTLSVDAEIQDLARNTSSDKWSFIVDSSHPRFQYVTAQEASGYYSSKDKSGNPAVIHILMHFNKPITVSGGTPSLRLSNNAVAVYAGTSVNDVVFNYRVSDGDDTDTAIKVTGIQKNGAAFRDGLGVDADPPATVDDSKNLDKYKQIKILTAKPAVESCTYDPSSKKLKLTFNCNISKSGGTVTVTQNESGLKAPAVISIDEFERLGGAGSAIGPLYSLGTSGSDLTPMYILNYTKNTGDSDVVGAYKTVRGHEVKISVSSNSVQVDGKELVVLLDGANEVPCLGADYKVSVSSGAVKNTVNLSNDLVQDKTFAVPGVEMPYLRIKTEEWTMNGKTASQPFTTNFKVDCETPGAKISYSGDAVGDNVTGEQSIGTAGDYSGKTYTLTFKAEKDGNEKSSECTLYKTVVVIKNIQTALNNAKSTAINGRWNSYDIGLWIRGGENILGGNTTAGLPLSWDVRDKKIALMSKKGSSDYFYYISWNVTKDMYFSVIAGTVEDNKKYPREICYPQNGWAKKDNVMRCGELTEKDGNNKDGDNNTINYETRTDGKITVPAYYPD